MLWNGLCRDTRRHVFSYLCTREYSTLRNLRNLSIVENQDILACVTQFKITNVESFYRFQKCTVPYYLKHLSINCNNAFVVKYSVHLPHLESLDFFTEYRFIRLNFDWATFFQQFEMPKVKVISWYYSDFDFLEMKRILEVHGIHRNIERIKITPSNPMFFTLEMEEYYPKTKNLVELYRSCENLRELRLDYEEKFMDSHYLNLIKSEMDFQHLKRLQLINRSKMLIDYLCKSPSILPHLEHLEIMWLFDTDDAFYTLNVYVNEFCLEIYKPRLQTLSLSHMSWGNLFKDFLCSVCLFSENCVNIHTNDVQIVVINCPNGYMQNGKK